MKHTLTRWFPLLLSLFCLVLSSCSDEESSAPLEPFTLHGTISGCHVLAQSENLTIGLFLYNSEPKKELAHSSALAAGATTFSFPVDAEPDESYTGALMSDGTTERIVFHVLVYQDEGAAGYDGETILGAGNHNIIYFSDDYESDGAVRGFNFALESDDSAYSQSFEGLQMDVTTSICDGLPGYGDDDDDDDDDDVLQSVLLTGQLLGCMVENATENLRVGLFQADGLELAASPVLPAGTHNWQINLSAPPSDAFTGEEMENGTFRYSFEFHVYIDAEGDGHGDETLLGSSEVLLYYFDGPYTQDNAREGYNFYSPKSVVHYSQRFADLLIDVVASDCE